MLKKDLPVIELKINPDDGLFVQAVALVEFPAIESNFISFSTSNVNFSDDDEKMELLGLAMIPNHPMYRNDNDLGEYAAIFCKETIREISQIYAKMGFFNKTNIEHSLIPAESLIFQSYIVDEDKDVNAPKGISAPSTVESLNGSWVIGVKVLSKSVWADIKAGKIKGFSVEGIFKMIDTKTSVKLSQSSELDIALKDLNDLEDLMNIIDKA